MPPKTQPVSAKESSPPEPPASFESGLEQLEQIVRQLERGDLPLEESIVLFERGVALGEACRRLLEAAETRIEMLRAPTGSRTEPNPAEAAASEPARGDDADEDVPF